MRQKSRGMVKIFQKKIRKSRYQPRQAARIVAGAADFRIQPFPNTDTDTTNRHSTTTLSPTISPTIQQPLSNPAPTLGNLNPSTTVLNPIVGLGHAKPSSNHPTTTLQPSFVSNPRTIPTQPFHICDSPDPTTSSCMALARPSTASVAASLPAPPATRRRLPGCWQWCHERCRRGETQNP